MSNQTSQSAVPAASPPQGALLAGQNRKVAAVRAMFDIVRLAKPQKWAIVFFLSVYFLASFVQTGGIYCFYAGFTLMTEPDKPPDWPMARALEVFSFIGLPSEWAWMVFLGGFIAMGIAAAAIDHWGRVLRLRLLSIYEANQMKRGLTMICDADPREVANISRREMVLALRSDCKAMRIVLQSVLQIVASLIQTIWPFILIFMLNTNMSLVGLGFLVVGFYPVYRLGKKAGSMTFERQDVNLAAGAQLSGMISGLQSGDLPTEDKGKVIEAIHLALEDQYKLWRQQYQIRSLCEKVPTLFSLLGTFAILIYGVMLINRPHLPEELPAMTWPGLMAFLVAAQKVFGQFSSIGSRTARAFENVLRAARHLEFIRRFQRLTGDHPTRAALPHTGPRARIDSIVVRDLALPQGRRGKLPPLNLTLRPGSLLTVVDPAMSLRNPLYQFLGGVRVVTSGQVLLNGVDINAVRYDSIQECFSMLRIAAGRKRASPGTLYEIMRSLQPALTRAEAEHFVLGTVGVDQYARFPQGMDTYVAYELRKKVNLPLACYWVTNLFRKHVDGKSVQVVDAFERVDENNWEMLEGYVRSYLGRGIYIWLDRRVRRNLPHQHIVVFNRGLYLGQGDLAWFERQFPDWENRDDVAATLSGKTDDLILSETTESEEEETEAEEEA